MTGDGSVAASSHASAPALAQEKPACDAAVARDAPPLVTSLPAVGGRGGPPSAPPTDFLLSCVLDVQAGLRPPTVKECETCRGYAEFWREGDWYCADCERDEHGQS